MPAIERERGRLLRFIRRHIADAFEAEDILQDVFCEFATAFHLARPVEEAGAWMFRVARNRIIDFFRRKRPESLAEEDARRIASREPGPEQSYAAELLLKALEEALAELPPEQREVFLAHELEGVSFKQLAARTGCGVNTLLSRKRYAVLHLRRRLQPFYDEMNGGRKNE